MSILQDEQVNIINENLQAKLVPSPFVLNGPSDQHSFHKTLIDMQLHNPQNNKDETFLKRLSLIDTVDGVKTAQSNLEAPKKIAKSWSSNYGTHGWHRYVGRFPPHLIRALLNYFQADSDDVVLDPFSGSGTTLVECRLLGIPAIGVEICPLSALISRAKSQFTIELANAIPNLINTYKDFYNSKWNDFLNQRTFDLISYEEIILREGNIIEPFANFEKWFIKEALLGTSITIEFAKTLEGQIRDLLLVALSSKMRSIGNMDVDVVRAEYSKEPRTNVKVFDLVHKQLLKMSKSIIDSFNTHKGLIKTQPTNVIEQDILKVTEIEENSISHIITSPPYGVEAISYLRTHLLSYRVLAHFLGTDPYKFGDNVIGSEFLPKEAPNVSHFNVADLSTTYLNFFNSLLNGDLPKKLELRTYMMMKFFEDISIVTSRLGRWLKVNGKIAFIIGNNKIGDTIIPTHEIITEIFGAYGLILEKTISHKLKTNNSNSQVPWQDRIIENEYLLIFHKTGETR
ncbi:DNA methyltransferase [Paenibacillus sp. GYB004]|uniref:DNA methyltransferase n=1 Tax=Paenibacillus sp. GYB004 TaxID=2994393 RepID=UPI002F961A01